MDLNTHTHAAHTDTDTHTHTLRRIRLHELNVMTVFFEKNVKMTSS